jgi:serine/threonine protein phosphatase PrpC
MNNIAHMNKVAYEQHQRGRYRSSERSNNSPNIYSNNNNNYINNIGTIKNVRNQNQNNIRSKKISKNNNIRYINQKNISNNSNQINYSQNMAMMKQFKSNNHKQIYLEGELNNFMNVQPNINGFSNINKQKERNVNYNFNNNANNYNNYMQRISNGERAKNNRGMPKKSPVPVQKGNTMGKYLNNSNISTISRYSNNTYNASYHIGDSQLLSNMSQISGYSNFSHNTQYSHGPLLENNRVRPYSNNSRIILSKNRKNNGIISYKRINSNQNIKRSNNNRSSNNNLNNNRQINNSPYSYNVKHNNYINNNMNMTYGLNKTKYVSKSPNPQGQYFSNTLNMNMKNNKKYMNQNQIQKQSNYNLYNNNNNYSFSNMSSTSNVSNNIANASFFSKITQNNNIYNPNVNIYENIRNEINYIMPNSRPLTSHSYKNRSNNTIIKKKNNNIKNNNKGNMMQNNISLYPVNPNENNYQNYNSNDIKQKLKMKQMLNNHNKMNNFNNNYVNGYNTNTSKRERSANLPSRRNNYNNNNINPMVNLHIINKGQIINNNYNNINNMNNNMNNLYIYKYDDSQNKQRKYGNTKMNFSKRKNIPIKNNNYINNNIGFSDDEMNMNMNILNEMQNRRSNSKKRKIRNNSSTGIGVTGELNNIINARNNLRAQQINIHKQNNNISKVSLNQSQISAQNRMGNNVKRTFITKKIRKIHHFTHVGFNGEKDKEFNQDIAFLEKNFAGNNSFLYMAVCDGHGVEGHEVSGFIKRTLPKDLSNALMNKEILTSDKNNKKKIYNIIGSTFIKVNEKLISNEAINSIFSGTTCVSLVYTPIKLICANIGDSRAVVGRYDKNNKKWISINLSRDHKPTEEDEARRILKKGGRIKPFLDEETGTEVGPPRVWVRDDEVPGLAMTRSFGDRVAAIAGTICVPEIKEYAFHEGDKFVILASDGVWEFISSEECINIIGKFYENNNIVECCNFLYEESRKRWLREEDVVDDITMLLIFFD